MRITRLLAVSFAALTPLVSSCTTRTVQPSPAPTTASQSALSTSAASEPLLIKPIQMSAAARPLVVLIHGCMQNAEKMKAGTGIESLAQDAFVLLPDQKPGRHGFNCWRWFEKENQTRDSGEIQGIVDQIREIQKSEKIDPKRIFVAGLSSGSGTAAALLACYPEVFAGGVLHSGPAYGYVSDEASAVQQLKNGPGAKQGSLPCEPSKFRGTVLVVQGTKDAVVSTPNAERLIEDFAPNWKSSARSKTLSLEKKGTRSFHLQCSKPKAQGDKCLMTVEGMGHAWSGGAANLPFMDPEGPSVTEAIHRLLVRKEKILR